MPVSRGEQSLGAGWSVQRGDVEENAEKKTASQDPYAPQTTGQDYYGPDVIAMAMAAIAIPLWLTYTFATTNEKVAIIVVAWVISVFLMLTRPYFGLVLFVGLLYVRPEEAFPVLNGLHLALVTSVTTLIGTLGMKVLRREKAIGTPLNGMICGFGVIVVISTLGGSLTSDAVQDMIKLIALVLLIVNLVRTRVQYQGLVSAILIFTAYLSCYSIYLYLQGGGIKDHDVIRSQATGIFGDPNDLAAAIDAGLALCLARVASARPSMRLVYLAASALMIAAVVLTNSRGGLLALIVVIAAFLLVFTRGKIGALFLALVIAVGMIKFGPSRLSKIDRDEESANSRLVFWANGVDQLVQHPLTGVGYGNFYNFNGGMTAHNSFVLCFAELGLPGYFCWLGCLYYCFQGVPKRREAEKETSKEALKKLSFEDKPERDNNFYDRNGARLALVGYLAAAFWLSRTYVPNLYLLIGLCVAQQMSANPQLWEWKRTKSEQKRDWQILLALVLVTISVIGIFSNRFK